ncbi:MAG: 3-dehydroquinate synthase [Armatimonadetes bacterium]|nr:3-dehydroquinate synthase [Armatimonadota bacterium]
MQDLQIKHFRGRYSVHFCSAKQALAGLSESAFVITDENVRNAWSSLLEGFSKVLVLPPGEPTKSAESLQTLWDWLARSGADRASEVAALGGGVIGDLAGFAAATYMRGVPFIQVPTTLLAQVDSSVGGKVGIDLPSGKNLAGAFWPPKGVFIAQEFLTTLPERQFVNGLAEVWKTAFIMDAGLLEVLDRGVPSPDSPNLAEIVRRCVDDKRRVVEVDEEDRSGRRAILNFGHTVGHALEHATGYSDLLHGEAVAIGMVAEAAIGEALGVAENGAREAIEERLARCGLPTRHPILRDPEPLIEAMLRDKKTEQGSLAMALVTRLGECKLVNQIPKDVVSSVLSSC